MVGVAVICGLMITAAAIVLGAALGAWLTAWARGCDCDREEAEADDARRAYDATLGGAA